MTSGVLARYAAVTARLPVKSLFRVTPGLRDRHDYRQDTAFDGRYLMRLPDRTLVPAEEYEQRLRQYLDGRKAP